MNSKLTLLARRARLPIVCFLVAFSGITAQAKDLRFEAFLIWATNAEKSPNPKHKPVDPEIRRKLKAQPFKWANYFEERREGFTFPKGGAKEVTLSEHCKIGVKDINGEYVEVSQIGKGVPVLKLTQRLPKGEMLILSGNAPDESGWLVVLKRLE